MGKILPTYLGRSWSRRIGAVAFTGAIVLSLLACASSGAAEGSKVCAGAELATSIIRDVHLSVAAARNSDQSSAIAAIRRAASGGETLQLEIKSLDQDGIADDVILALTTVAILGQQGASLFAAGTNAPQIPDAKALASLDGYASLAATTLLLLPGEHPEYALESCWPA